ncbi:squalene/phytoene synthase family protein [Hyphobacterium marinum]|uniref:Squalene/phytoene synthase family protein n=1 Tax=Hyphobacterium marinum TaxID=3116574 RepID=A0ABU7M1G4_9PROT|nr:squalene/phytoene synthase family protein [Hyphobacterium sp. Y6023]MEE2567636.1 squalene/phytoene synthase family protein [Hyphobacterium sp. Y6023]
MTDTTFHDGSSSGSDGQLAALFAREPQRTALTALHAWHAEISGLPLRISEPAIGAMRMAWHREAVDDAFADPPAVRRNPVIEGVAAMRDMPGSPGATALTGIIDAHDRDFEGRSFSGLDAMAEFAGAGWGKVMSIAAGLLDPEVNEAEPIAAAGEAWGLTEILRSFPYRAGRGLATIPDDVMAEHGLTLARIATGREPELVRKALQPVISLARERLEVARTQVRQLPPVLFPAWAPVALSGAYLNKLERADDPYRADLALSPLTRRLTLMKASLTGRF